MAGQRVVIAEDSVLLLAGLTKLLESAGVVVAATAGDAEGLLAAVERERPDVVVADVRMPRQRRKQLAQPDLHCLLPRALAAAPQPCGKLPH